MPDPSGTCDCAYVTCAQLWVSMSLRPLLTVNKMTVQNDVVHFVLGFPNKNELIFVHVLRTKRDGDKPAA